MNANRFYISSGAKNAQYTLRARFDEFDHRGRLVTRDQYIRNLGIDLDRAKEKAALEAGESVEVVPFELNPYGHADEVERSMREAEREAIERSRTLEAARAAESMRQRRAENALSQWQGAEGERITRTLDCLKWVPIGVGAYGTRFLAVFSDELKNKYVFFGGAALSLPSAGNSATVTFTVKRHTEYDGCHQTVISRPKLTSKKES